MREHLPFFAEREKNGAPRGIFVAA